MPHDLTATVASLTSNSERPSFLCNGGEMGELTWKFNWSQSSLGTPETWPQSLKTTVATILRSKFPIFLFWGQDNICFYNDAFRSSLANEGKHPAVGKKGADVWSEVRNLIAESIEQVKKTGEVLWHEDRVIPIYRNGIHRSVGQ